MLRLVIELIKEAKPLYTKYFKKGGISKKRHRV